MKQKPKTVEEKEGSPEGPPSFPSLVGHMKNNPSADSLQAHVAQFFNQLPDPISPQDLPQLLQLALTKMIDAALAQERQFHLQDHPEDRANGYAPPMHPPRRGHPRLPEAAPHPPRPLPPLSPGRWVPSPSPPRGPRHRLCPPNAPSTSGPPPSP